MTDPADITIVRGNAAAQPWQLMQDETTPLDLTGSEMVLFVRWRGGSIRKTTADGGLTMDAAAGTVTWTYTPTESRSLPPGRVARYEIERRIAGEQKSIVTGYVIAEEGINDD